MTVAVVTLLYDTSYLPGSLLLGSILKDMIAEHDTEVQLSILIDHKIFTPHQILLLLSIYDEVLDIPIIKTKLTDKLVNELKRPELDKTYSKINLWNLPYEKVLYLDADTLPNPSSNLLDLLKLDFHESKILASPDSGFPDIFNSGMFVIKPNTSDYENLVKLASSADEVSFDGADQGLLNQYFNSDPDWVVEAVEKGRGAEDKSEISSKWIPLPFLYNVTPNTQYEYAPAYNYFSSASLEPFAGSFLSPAVDLLGHSLDKTKLSSQVETSYGYTASSHHAKSVKLIHYIGPQKPWKFPYNRSHLEWWTLWHKYFGDTSFSTVDGVTQSKYTSKDSLWDASKTSPPHSNAKSVSDIPRYENTWDKDSNKPKTKSILKHGGSNSKHNRVSVIPPELEPRRVREEKEKQSVYGFHPFQKAERLFGGEDYVPTHPVIGKLKAKEEKHPLSTGVDVNEVNQKLEKLGLGK